MQRNLDDSTKAPLRNVIYTDKFRKNSILQKEDEVGSAYFRENAQGGVDYKFDAIGAINALAMLEALLLVSAKMLAIYEGA